MSVGMVIMRPTSVVVAGGGSETASIRAAGGVEFASATSLSLNGVFTASYDNYMISIRSVGTAYVGLNYRLRSGTDNSTASSYVVQYIAAYSTTVAGQRNTNNYADGGAGAISSSQRSGQTLWVYGPNLAQPTASRVISITGENGGDLWDYAGTHNQSTSYDGITIYPNSGSFTGMVTVYGYAQ